MFQMLKEFIQASEKMGSITAWGFSKLKSTCYWGNILNHRQQCVTRGRSPFAPPAKCYSLLPKTGAGQAEQEGFY